MKMTIEILTLIFSIVAIIISIKAIKITQGQVEIEIRRNPNQEALIKEALDIIKASKAAMNKKNINAIKQAITHLEKIKEAFSKIGYGNLYQ